MWKVRDVMQAQVVTVPPDLPVRELVHVLATHRISGVPVVNATGTMLGVVSTSDVMVLAAYGADAHVRDPWEVSEGAEDEESSSYFKDVDAPIQFDTATRYGATEYVVEDIMTPATYSVGPELSIPELARFLLRGRIHRALVVDDGRLIGIVTTFDILNAVAAATEDPDLSDLAMAGCER